MEHVIPRALGGHLARRGLLCRECNNELGQTIDAELERQLGVLADHLGIKRQHDKKREKRYILVSADGQRKVVGKRLKPLDEITYPTPNGRPVTEYIPRENTESFIKRKKLNLESHGLKTEFRESIKENDGVKYFFSNNLSDKYKDIAFGGRDFFHSIAKIVVNYAVLNNIDLQQLVEVIELIKGKVEYNKYVFWYYPTHYQIQNLDKDEVNHVLFLKGDTQHRILYVYIELFSTQNLIVLLNTEYDGPALTHTYAYDLMKNKEVEKEIKIRMTRGHFLNLNMSQAGMLSEHIRLFNRLEAIIERNQLVEPIVSKHV